MQRKRRPFETQTKISFHNAANPIDDLIWPAYHHAIAWMNKDGFLQRMNDAWPNERVGVYGKIVAVEYEDGFTKCQNIDGNPHDSHYPRSY